MSHIEIEQKLTDYLFGELNNAESTKVEEHLCGCPQCTAMLDELRSVVGTLKRDSNDSEGTIQPLSDTQKRSIFEAAEEPINAKTESSDSESTATKAWLIRHHKEILSIAAALVISTALWLTVIPKFKSGQSAATMNESVTDHTYRQIAAEKKDARPLLKSSEEVSIVQDFVEEYKTGLSASSAAPPFGMDSESGGFTLVAPVAENDPVDIGQLIASSGMEATELSSLRKDETKGERRLRSESPLESYGDLNDQSGRFKKQSLSNKREESGMKNDQENLSIHKQTLDSDSDTRQYYMPLPKKTLTENQINDSTEFDASNIDRYSVTDTNRITSFSNIDRANTPNPGDEVERKDDRISQKETRQKKDEQYRITHAQKPSMKTKELFEIQETWSLTPAAFEKLMDGIDKNNGQIKQALQYFGVEVSEESESHLDRENERLVLKNYSIAEKRDIAQVIENLRIETDVRGIRNQGKIPSMTDAQSNPLSTFSIDVDTASYTAARSDILNGRRPQASAIRAEEFINYFDYKYRPPKPVVFGMKIFDEPHC